MGLHGLTCENRDVILHIAYNEIKEMVTKPYRITGLLATFPDNFYKDWSIKTCVCVTNITASVYETSTQKGVLSSLS